MPAMDLGAARLLRLRLPLPLALRQINVYLIQGPDAVALVDTGMALPADHDRPGHQGPGAAAGPRGAGFATALPAHGPPIANIDRRIDEILLHHHQREALVLSLIEQPTSCYALSEALFQISRLDGWETLMAVGETLAHLRSLVARSRVKQVQRDGVILFTSS